MEIDHLWRIPFAQILFQKLQVQSMIDFTINLMSKAAAICIRGAE